MKHAKLSASGSHRWLVCAGSVEAEEGYKNSSSSPAQEGTAAHELADICLRSGDSADKYLGEVIEKIKVDGEMVEYVQGYLDYVRSFDGELLSEQQVDYSPWVIGGYGTSDCIIISDDTVRVVDLKYGKGLAVQAENNSQGLLYCLGVYNDFGYLLDAQDTFIVDIYQPRIGNFSQFEISLKDLLKWGDWVSMRADLALSKNAERTPGEKQCQWCLAKADCKELYNHTQKVIMSEFDDLDAMENPNTLTNNQKKSVLENKALIESWLKSVESSVMELLLNGGEFEGYKLVEGRSNRKWRDEAEAVESLLTIKNEDEIFTKKLITVAQAEKVLGKKDKGVISDLIIKPAGKPTLVPASDKRPSIDDVKNCFDNLDS